MSGFFVTSSGTDIGKTHVSAILCRQLVAKGRVIQPLKPVLSGFEESAAADSDSAILLAAAGQSPTMEAIRAITPWRFEAALSPDMAAAREGREIGFQPLVDFCRGVLDQAEDLVLIEGAGGVLAPINHDHRMVDIPRVLGLPALLVVGSYLGTISHTLAACESLERHGVALTGIMMSESEVSPVPMEETRDALLRYLEDIPIALVPRLPLEDWHKAPDLTGLTAL